MGDRRAWELSDGVVSIRSLREGDSRSSWRDATRSGNAGSGQAPGYPSPQRASWWEARSSVGSTPDPDEAHLAVGEINLGYNVFAAHCRRGMRHVRCSSLLARLAQELRYDTGVLRVDRGNTASLGVAARAVSPSSVDPTVSSCSGIHSPICADAARTDRPREAHV